MSEASRINNRKVKDATLVFVTKTDCCSLTDRQVRIKIEALQELLLQRQQERDMKSQRRG
jgi:hypothetical protein